MLGEACKLRVRAGAEEDPRVAFGKNAPTLTLKRPGHDSRSAARRAGADDLVNEVDKLIREAHRDLFGHPKTVAPSFRLAKRKLGGSVPRP